MSIQRKQTGVFYGWWVVIAGVVVYATLLGSHQTFGVFFKPIQTEFGWSRAVTAIAFFVGGLTQSALSPVTGILSDRYGPRIVITGLGIIASTGYFLASQVQSQWQLYSYFILMASGMSFWVPIQAMVSRWFTKRRGLVLGLTGIGGGLGQAVWPPLAQVLIDQFGWRSAYMIMAVILAVVVISAAQILKGTPKERGLVPYGEEDKDNDKDRDKVANTRENTQASLPAFKLRQALRTKAFWMILVGISTGSFTLQMTWIHLVPYVTDPGIGLSAVVGATLLSTIGWSNVVGKVILGNLSDRIGSHATLGMCYGMAGLSMVWLIFAKDLWALYLFAAALGFFYGGWIPMQAAFVGSIFGLSSMGAILGALQMGTSIAGPTGAIVAGHIYDVTGSYYYAFIIGAVLFFTASTLVFLVRKPDNSSIAATVIQPNRSK